LHFQQTTSLPKLPGQGIWAQSITPNLPLLTVVLPILTFWPPLYVAIVFPLEDLIKYVLFFGTMAPLGTLIVESFIFCIELFLVAPVACPDALFNKKKIENAAQSDRIFLVIRFNLRMI
jgi:hypothetical protein